MLYIIHFDIVLSSVTMFVEQVIHHFPVEYFLHAGPVELVKSQIPCWNLGQW